jgi:DNA-binding MarR family transcriptional regulator
MAVAAEPTSAPLVEVADTFVGLMRSFHRVKARFVAEASHDVEWSSQIVLRLLAREGPMRASDIAGALHSDPSTVSRQVATMVKDGLLERQADPEDGRASILALTSKADAVIAEYERVRLAHFAAMLSDWDMSDLSEFARMLRRFTQDFEKSSSALVSAPSGAAEGNH